jgi:glycosyltransferase involved in cell wall biosynthesis
VRLVGHRDDAARWLQAADLVALPSRWEGLPFVLLEAMATGRCVVAADIAPMREVVEGVGDLVPVDDVPALAAAIADRLLDPASTARDALRARGVVESAHDLRVQVAAVLTRCEAVARG